MTVVSRAGDGAGLIAYRRSEDIDAIDEHSRHLVDALRQRGNSASYSARGLPPTRQVDAGLAWILVQYNPFSYGRWGFAPDLVSAAAAIRRRLAAPLAVMVHEAWVESHDWKSALMGGYQRMQLQGLSRIATVSMATTQAMARDLGPGSVHVPVASNITPITASFRSARDRLGLGDEFIVALFGRGNPSRALTYAEVAIEAIALTQGADRVRVFNLGADAPALRTHSSIDIVSPGEMSAEMISLHLWASDLMLLPFTDGLSTRRTTLMAALAHGLPVLGLRGPATDDVLIERDDVLTLTAVADREAFKRAAVDLASDRDRLRGRGEAARRLYLEHFDWPHVARRVMEAIEGVPPTAGDMSRPELPDE